MPPRLDIDQDTRSTDKPRLLKFAGVANSVAFSQGGRTLAAGGCQGAGSDRNGRCPQGVVQLWNLEKLAPENTLRLPRPVTVLAVSPDGREWVAGDNEGRLIFSRVVLKNIPKPIHQKGEITALAFSPDGKWVAAGSMDPTFPLGFLDIATGGMIKIKMHFDPVSSLAFSPDGTELAVGTAKGRLVIWNFNSSSLPLEITARSGEKQAITSATFSPDGRLVAYGSRNGRVVIWDRRSFASFAEFKRGSAVNALMFSPDSRYLAVGEESGKLQVVESESGREIWTKRHVLSVSDLAYSPDGHSLAVAAQGGLYVYNMGQGSNGPRTIVRARADEKPESQRSLPVSTKKFAEILRISQNEYVWLLPFDRIVDRAVASMVEQTDGPSLDRQGDKLIVRDGDRSVVVDLHRLKTAEGKYGLSQAVQAYESAQRFLLSSRRSAINMENAAIAGVLRELGPGLRLIDDREATPMPTTDIHGVVETVFDGNVHYLKVQGFDRDTGKYLLSRTVGAIGEEPHLLLDLRDNSGAKLEDSIVTASAIIPRGQLIAEIISRKTGDRLDYRSDGPVGPRKNITVLVNERTAGTAEMIACAVRESGIGIVVGSRTAGVDDIHTTYAIPDGSALKVSTGRFFCPNSRSIRWEGMKVDIEIGNSPAAATVIMESGSPDRRLMRSRSIASNMALASDHQLKAAVGVARCLSRDPGFRLEALGESRSKVLRAMLSECQRNQY